MNPKIKFIISICSTLYNLTITPLSNATVSEYDKNAEKIETEQIMKHKQYYKDYKDQIINLLANYTIRTPKELNHYLKNDVDLHFLIVAAAISKTSQSDLSKIIQYKKEGKSLDETMKSVNAKPKAVFDEVKKIHYEIKNME